MTRYTAPFVRRVVACAVQHSTYYAARVHRMPASTVSDWRQRYAGRIGHKMQREILEYLGTHGPRSCDDVASALGLFRDRTANRLCAYVREGKLVRTGTAKKALYAVPNSTECHHTTERLPTA